MYDNAWHYACLHDLVLFTGAEDIALVGEITDSSDSSSSSDDDDNDDVPAQASCSKPCKCYTILFFIEVLS